jgi:hypothetical protein
LLSKPAWLFAAIFALLLAARLCHMSALWAEENLPLAAALQMQAGKTPYRDFWFDKPPLLPAAYLLWGAHTGWIPRAAGALYGLVVCLLAYAIARRLWSVREAHWAAGLMAFFLVFWIHSAVTPLAADILMVAPHMAAIYLAIIRRPFWSGALAGSAFLINAKGLFVAASCVIWNPAGFLLIGAGFGAVNTAALPWLWAAGALTPYYEQVWHWGRIYAGRTFVDAPVKNAILRTLNWTGFHAAAIMPAVWFARDRRSPRARFAAWALVSLAAVALGWRFFPRYYFQLLPVLVLAAARGLELMGRRRAIALALLLIPAARFGPRYALLAADLAQGRRHEWRDLAMERDSREAAALVRRDARPGDTLFVWGFRPELYAYTGLPAVTPYLDSQALTGVPADRHLTQSEPVDREGPRANRTVLAQTRPVWLLDGLGPYNPALAMRRYPELREWLEGYREAGRTDTVVVYRLAEPGARLEPDP